MTDHTPEEAEVDPASIGTELDALAREVRESKDREKLEALWHGTMNLERWYFAGVGQFPNMRPFSGIIDDEPYVMAFTTRARAEKYAHLQNLVPEGGKASVMSFPVPEAARLCVGQHVLGAKWVVFDDGWAGWRFPLDELAPIMNRYRDDG
ncbi:MAG: hypothetical protein VX012_07960 [Planctomycetota bacterium]|nr:hypothetical protein [Planctomycetota bacterium]